MKLWASLLLKQVGQLAQYSYFSKHVRVTSDAIRVWLEALSAFYFSFKIQPWSKNIIRSLLKQPKIYLWDWADIEDLGAKHENIIACHLLKAIHWWEDCGLGEYGLYFLRDKEKREVDFLVEVKATHNCSISDNLHYFQQQTKAKHAFQVVFDLPYQEINCLLKLF